MHGFQLVDNAADSNLFPPLQASLDRAQTALTNRVAAQTEAVNLFMHMMCLNPHSKGTPVINNSLLSSERYNARVFGCGKNF